ncbi:EF hand domain-containing protein [Lepidopterella palustris CBS 459.81]|uniref:EF hand domain-containing protein n=1 Tax=Lepidopterella palustris CBS 459.81 TaxID=1314670 RepID=A0A8E2JCI1_9PEZI|nr:EF hand domain-containing protein [Lepidopterella palustris CBS 459.81]
MGQLHTLRLCLLLLLALIPNALAHGGHEQVPVAADADWATRHMAEEHHISSFDAGVFFSLHDYDSSGSWSPEDVRRTYGLMDESTNNVPEEKKSDVVRTVMDLYDVDKSGTISYAEFTAANAKGVVLPDFGLGPGHHGDDEYEYEIHHFEKFHDENTKEEDLIHPEDIAHFAKHDREEDEREAWEKKEKEGIVESNIPAKFRKGA